MPVTSEPIKSQLTGAPSSVIFHRSEREISRIEITPTLYAEAALSLSLSLSLSLPCSLFRSLALSFALSLNQQVQVAGLMKPTRRTQECVSVVSLTVDPNSYVPFE